MTVDREQVFAAAERERRAVAELLAGLDAEQLATPSLCAGWDVRTVAAHLVTALTGADRRFVTAALRARGNLHRANDALAREEARRPVTDLVGRLQRSAGHRVSPPVVGPRGPLTDVLVHGGDMRVPLGLPHDPAADGVRAALDFVTGSRAVGFVPRARLAGLRLVAEDLDVAHGEGADVRGRGIEVLMAVCGRRALLGTLRGPGVPVLARRLSAG
ncbi:maleylpyruvate isomerase family mycothiol-dependent enzyme [Modestobacter altitudinis]|uniref:maleylpyruvate isomerase family mycothiol-dependent enzyme n=1 Tax=Modestobacter altitudinis TaxID=2213158 RepID=UPI001C553FBA|nr:maleylpyruvate isomerase family mycothiol-dependent enzyme [Modestobacter altitudinis]